MTTADGSVLGVQKIVDHGPDADRYNVVLLADGYRDSEMAKYAADVARFVATLQAAAPFDQLWSAVNVHRVDVTSTDSGADDPASCPDGSIGSGATARTYFDSTFCSGGLRRVLTCNDVTARYVARTQVPGVHMTMVAVNSTIYGGSGGPVGTFSMAPSAEEIALHEMGHTAFGLADEYETFQGCGTGETGHDVFPFSEPQEPNVTIETDPARIKWRALLTQPSDGLPTTVNADCSDCDRQPNPKSADYVGAYAGARYFHCGCFRPSFNCRMRTLSVPYCAVCQDVIRKTLTPYLPPGSPYLAV